MTYKNIKTKHTPGPWIVRNPTTGKESAWGRGRGKYEVGPKGKECAAWIRGGRKTADANANLIAAAPKMAEALETIMQISNDPGVIKIAEKALQTAIGNCV